MWQNWLNVILGLWIIVVAFLDMSGTSLVWTLVVSGAAITAFAFWGSMETSTEREEGKMVHRVQHQ